MATGKCARERKETINHIVDSRPLGGGDSIADDQFSSRVSFGEYGGLSDTGHNEVLTPIRWPQVDPIIVETDNADATTS